MPHRCQRSGMGTAAAKRLAMRIERDAQRDPARALGGVWLEWNALRTRPTSGRAHHAVDGRARGVTGRPFCR